VASGTGVKKSGLVGTLAVLRVDRVARIGSHVVIWTIVLVPTVIEMVRGWRPLLGDDATTTLRSYQVLSFHPPLVGMHSDAAVPGHLLYELGPLQFVLLTIPVHIDHLQGALWGSALVLGLVLSVTVEAMWSVGRWLGCALVALSVADFAWTCPSVFGHELWAPDFGLVFLLASIGLAWVVSIGSFAWWPVLVFTASVTVQAELFYGLPAVALVLICPLLGCWHSGRRPQGFRWLFIGIGVGVACWLPSLIQQIFGSYGNLGGTLSARNQPTFGLPFGLRNIAGVVWPCPLPLRQYALYTSYTWLESKPALAGVGALAILAAIAVIAGRYRFKDLACLATIGLACSVCVVVAFASVPRVNVGSLSWLVPAVWLVGLLWWLTVVWGVVELARSHIPRRSSARRPYAYSGPFTFSLGVALAVLVTVGVWKLPSQSSVNPVSPQEGVQVSNLVQSVARKVPPGEVTIKFWPKPTLSPFGPEDYVEYQYGQAILWRLTTAGFQPLMQSFFTDLSGITNSRRQTSRTVNVIMNRDSWSSVIEKVVIGRYDPSSEHRTS
jgi:hypothetical protein